MKLKKNITSMFLVPVLGINKSLLSGYNFLNGYSDFEEKTLEYENHVIYMLFKPPDLVKFQAFVERQYKKNKNLLEDFNWKDDLIVLIFKFPKEFEKDCTLIKQSKYSKTSEKFKKIFPDTVKIIKNGEFVRKKTLQRMVFDKDIALINYWQDKIDTEILYTENMEVWEGFNKNKETLKILNIREEFKKQENERRRKESEEDY